MDAPIRDSPAPKRARTAANNSECALTALPDTAIHRIFDFSGFEGDPDNLYPPSPCGSHDLPRTTLSHTCRRFQKYYRNCYVTSEDRNDNLDFADFAFLLVRYPRLTVFGPSVITERLIETGHESYHRVTEVYLMLDGEARSDSLLQLSLFCPGLKILTLFSMGCEASLVGLDTALTFRHLEVLQLEHLNASREDMLKRLYGRENLRELVLMKSERFIDPGVFVALPHSIRSLSLLGLQIRNQSTIDECLHTIGRLPQLKKLTLELEWDSNWLLLLPAAVRLEEFSMYIQDATNESFCTLIPSMSNLKRLEVIAFAGDFGSLLPAIASLGFLESLDLYFRRPVECMAVTNLKLLFSGPVRSSLLKCTIVLNSSDEEKVKCILQCFNDEVRPLFENCRDCTLKFA
mmetsp:Transcript_4243/g.10469  ORF Transcript_4243/g.10469 Transcript_4243/m.10469 type:complete len:404 (-) Transcript_4243:566-1777(-)